MGEYSDEELEEVCDKADQWFDEFSKSPFFDELTEEQKEESGFIISTFTEYMYTYHSRTPDEWDESGLEECCLETLSRKITADESYYRSIAPVLSAFFNFAGKEDLLKNSSNLAKKVKKIDKQIIINSNDPSNWGMAKSFMMSAKRSGVNLEDKREVDAFFYDIRQRQFASLTGKHRSKVGRNDPCSCGSGKKYKKCCGR